MSTTAVTQEAVLQFIRDAFGDNPNTSKGSIVGLKDRARAYAVAYAFDAAVAAAVARHNEIHNETGDATS